MTWSAYLYKTIIIRNFSISFNSQGTWRHIMTDPTNNTFWLNAIMNLLPLKLMKFELIFEKVSSRQFLPGTELLYEILI